MENLDENIFFRQAALKICSNLDIEEAMFRCLEYLKKFIPVDHMFLQIYEPGFTAMRTIASADTEKGSKFNLLTPLSDAARGSIKQVENLKFPEIMIQSEPEKYPVSREMLRFHNIKANSIIILALKNEATILGSLILISTGKDELNDEHARLIYLLKEPFSIALSNALRHLEIVKLKKILQDDNRYLHSELRRRSGDVIIGADFGLKEVMQQVMQVAALDSPVLISGETGVGKDVVAGALHYSSHRRDDPFISVNCGAIPDSLLDSELFGHEKGAFTGAQGMKRGRFERADRGTIFLDEIGELPPQAQVRLLRVLQNKEIERVGGTKTITLDIRIIAATNRDLRKMVTENKFREDLFFRLNVFPIHVPPLRSRVVDIPELVQHFMAQKAKELKLPNVPELKSEAIAPLLKYNWPGNVRELQNIVERALILHKNTPVSFDKLLFTGEQNSEPGSVKTEAVLNLDDVIRKHISSVLRKTGGKIHGPDGAAEVLGVNASTLRNRMRNLGIDFARYNKK